MVLRLVSKGSFYLCKPHILQYCCKAILETLPYKVLLRFLKFFIHSSFHNSRKSSQVNDRTASKLSCNWNRLVLLIYWSNNISQVQNFMWMRKKKKQTCKMLARKKQKQTSLNRKMQFLLRE